MASLANQNAQSSSKSSSPAVAIRGFRAAFVGMATLSGLSNILMLTGAFFMLEIYDRVLPSRSMPTLLGLAILAGILYAFLGLVDLIRSRLMTRVGYSIDESLGGRIYDIIVRLPLKIGAQNDGTQPLRDLDRVRAFFSGLGPIALFDLPWMPVYIGICFDFQKFVDAAGKARKDGIVEKRATV